MTTVAESASKPPSPSSPPAEHGHQSFWLWVMCLTGVDYFSTLAYQPSIAFESAGLLAPFATVVLIVVTLFGALPIYRYVARRSHEGQGSIGMLASLVSGWPGKILVLILLGFAATDYVITKTLSAADAAEHLIHNPNWPLAPDQPSGEDRQRVIVTMSLLVLLGAMFLRGFREVIGIAVVLVGIFLLLNVIVIGAGIVHLIENPERVTTYMQRLQSGKWYLETTPVSGTGLGTMILISLLFFPKLALGLSGFETGVAVMPLIRGDLGDDPKNPEGRIRSTQKMLLTAAVIMSFFLFGSSLVVTILIEPDQIVDVDPQTQERTQASPDAKKPPASERALAYIAHGEAGSEISPIFGNVFGTIYDLVTVMILWFAGASAMAGLLNLVPRYLPRYGMAPEWARAIRPLVFLFTAINIAVTFIFDASVKGQSDAYATGVLMLITSACIASVIDVWRHREGKWYRRISWSFLFITVVFVYTTVDVVLEKPAGIKIASFFIVTILATSFYSRVRRSRELRFSGFHLVDVESKLYWDTIKHFEMSILVPHRPGRRSLEQKEATIRREHRIPPEMSIVFVEVNLSDASEFLQEPWMEIQQEEGRFIVKVTHSASIAHVLAALALDMAKVGRPPEIHFGWTDDTPLSGTLGFLFFGEGNVPWMVRELIRRAEPNEEKRPLIVVAGT